MTRQQRRAEERAAAKIHDVGPSFVEKEDGRYMRLNIEEVKTKGFRIRQNGTNIFMRGPGGHIVYFPSAASAQAGLDSLKAVGEEIKEREKEAPVLADPLPDTDPCGCGCGRGPNCELHTIEEPVDDHS